MPGVGLGGAQRNVDLEDEPVWNLMAALAVSATTAQHQILVQELREKILENVFAAKEWAARTGGAGGGADLRIRNVNLLVSSLGAPPLLDSCSKLTTLVPHSSTLSTSTQLRSTSKLGQVSKLIYLIVPSSLPFLSCPSSRLVLETSKAQGQSEWHTKVAVHDCV